MTNSYDIIQISKKLTRENIIIKNAENPGKNQFLHLILKIYKQN